MNPIGLKKTLHDGFFMLLFDVAVIGAGPAGGSAARNSAKNGLKTVVLEEHKTIGEPVHCGECLDGLAFKRLNLTR